MARKSVVWGGKRRHVRRFARLYREGLSTFAIAKLERHITGANVKPYQVYNLLRGAGIGFRPLAVAMRNAPCILHVTVRI